VEDYVEKMRKRIAGAFKQKGRALPDRLATPHTPDTVAVERLEPGKYRMVISSKKGIAQAFLEISNPL
jgi:hypothetical protein